MLKNNWVFYRRQPSFGEEGGGVNYQSHVHLQIKTPAKLKKKLQVNCRSSCVHKIPCVYTCMLQKNLSHNLLDSNCDKCDKNNLRITAKRYAHLQLAKTPAKFQKEPVKLLDELRS